MWEEKTMSLVGGTTHEVSAAPAVVMPGYHRSSSSRRPSVEHSKHDQRPLSEDSDAPYRTRGGQGKTSSACISHNAVPHAPEGSGQDSTSDPLGQSSTSCSVDYSALDGADTEATTDAETNCMKELEPE